MPRYIIELGGKLLEWSTVVDAPVSEPMDEAEFRAHYQNCYGTDGMRDLDSRLERVRATGCSSLGGLTADDVIQGNRAGPNEKTLSKAALLKALGIHRNDSKITRSAEAH